MIVIVTGMHRSGTSALAGLLHHNGICMGEDRFFLPRALPENAKGFYEDIRYRRVNDDILGSYGYNVSKFHPNIPPIPAISVPLQARIKNLIGRREGNWGFKDPRTCLTIKYWLRHMRPEDVRILVMVRPYGQIARSMVARGNGPADCLERFGELAKNYYVTLSDELAHRPEFKLYRISLPALVGNPDIAAKRLSNFLGVPITDTSFIDRSLVHHGRGEG